MADIDRQAVILIANEGGLFSMSPACQRWLAQLDRSQRAAEPHFVSVQDGARTVLLARSQRSPLQARLGDQEILTLGKIYQAAVATAVAQHRPICLTDLFDHDPRTVDQCVEAMLAPVRRCYREGLQPAIHIRVSSLQLRERIVAALNLLLAAAPLAERAAVEVADSLTEADLQVPGLIMVSIDSANPLSRQLARRHAQLSRTAAPGAALSCIGPRKRLGSNTRTHLYFYARPCPLKKGLPDGARIAGEYAALFEAARQHGCKLVTMEVLSEIPGHEGILSAALSAAILAARAMTPDLKVRILTRNEKISDGMQGCF